MKLNKQAVLFFLLMIAATTIIKLVCAPVYELSGITGIFAIALFAGLEKFKVKYTFLLPLVTLLASDIIIQALYSMHAFAFAGFYKGQYLNYALVIVLTGIGLLFRNAKTAGVFIAAILGPTVFFFVSNYITWAGSWQVMGYTNDMAGLKACYAAGLPFYRNSLVSTIVLLPSFMMVYHLMVNGKAKLATT